MSEGGSAANTQNLCYSVTFQHMSPEEMLCYLTLHTDHKACGKRIPKTSDGKDL